MEGGVGLGGFIYFVLFDFNEKKTTSTNTVLGIEESIDVGKDSFDLCRYAIIENSFAVERMDRTAV